MSCRMPLTVRAKSGDYVAAPCGKCAYCIKRRIDGWVFRLSQEEKIHSSSSFITLTYDNISVPMTANGFMTLVKRDLQLFFKKLRKYTGCQTIKYYAVGEYGGKTMRPHYHLIIFDAGFRCYCVELDAWCCTYG